MVSTSAQMATMVDRVQPGNVDRSNGIVGHTRAQRAQEPTTLDLEKLRHLWSRSGQTDQCARIQRYKKTGLAHQL